MFGVRIVIPILLVFSLMLPLSAQTTHSNSALGNHFKSGQRLSLHNRPTEVAGPGPVCSILPSVEAASYRQSATDTSGF